jgi:hypothetical protein
MSVQHAHIAQSTKRSTSSRLDTLQTPDPETARPLVRKHTTTQTLAQHDDRHRHIDTHSMRANRLARYRTRLTDRPRNTHTHTHTQPRTRRNTEHIHTQTHNITRQTDASWPVLQALLSEREAGTAHRALREGPGLQTRRCQSTQEKKDQRFLARARRERSTPRQRATLREGGGEKGDKRGERREKETRRRAKGRKGPNLSVLAGLLQHRAVQTQVLAALQHGLLLCVCDCIRGPRMHRVEESS